MPGCDPGMTSAGRQTFPGCPSGKVNSMRQQGRCLVLLGSIYTVTLSMPILARQLMSWPSSRPYHSDEASDIGGGSLKISEAGRACDGPGEVRPRDGQDHVQCPRPTGESRQNLDSRAPKFTGPTSHHRRRCYCSCAEQWSDDDDISHIIKARPVHDWVELLCSVVNNTVSASVQSARRLSSS